ncbi:MAG: DUF2784 domain-containing protein [Proteobacteria bacterium]|jgi:hypothetical protein|nr:DUF2784 domain-containing protein [Pseudomonadota bacterium]
MQTEFLYVLAADLILLLHTLFVAFVVLGLLLIFVGKALSWEWVHNFWFRLAHLVGIAIVVVQAWLGIICPLTTWEMALRAKGGDIVYAGTFIAHWLDALLYYQAPDWVFIVIYTVFGALVLASWVWVRPKPLSESR